MRKQQPHLSVSVLGRWAETHWQNWRPGDGFCWVVFPAHYFPSNMFAVICAVQSGAQTRTETQTWRLRTETWDGLWSGQSRTGSVISLWGLGWVSVVGLLCLVISWSVCGWMLVQMCVCVSTVFGSKFCRLDSLQRSSCSGPFQCGQYPTHQSSVLHSEP